MSSLFVIAMIQIVRSHKMVGGERRNPWYRSRLPLFGVLNSIFGYLYILTSLLRNLIFNEEVRILSVELTQFSSKPLNTFQ